MELRNVVTKKSEMLLCKQFRKLLNNFFSFPPLHSRSLLLRHQNGGLEEAENGGLGDSPADPRLATATNDAITAHGHNQLPPALQICAKSGSSPTLTRSMAVEMKESREKAILVDRFSRVAFPLSFTILNLLYWAVYFEWQMSEVDEQLGRIGEWSG